LLREKQSIEPMRTSLLVLLLLLAGTALPFWWSPYSASGRLSLALADRDEQVLAQSVDIERLQRIVAHNVRTSHSVQRSSMLDRKFQEAFDALVADLMQQEIERRTRPETIRQLVQGALGTDLQGTRFERAQQVLGRDTLEWHDLSSVYVGSIDGVRLLMRRSGLVWRVVGLEFPEPKLKLQLQLGSGAPRTQR
jgi:hypothetical protein